MVLRLLLAFTCIALSLPIATALAPLPEELKRTGLSEEHIRRLVDLPAKARAAPAEKCAINGTGFPAATLPSELDLLKRNSFVKRKGQDLTLAGFPFRAAGPNVYWLGLDENVIPDPAYPSKTRVLEVMGDVSAMRGTAIRGHTLGISVGNPLSVETALDVFNDEAYESIDFAILAARIYGLKLVIPLVDNYNYYHGGKYTFIGWNGIPFNGTGANITPPDVGAFFFNETKIVDSYKRYITQHLNHVSRYTGIAIKDDPTIMAWESGNELSAIRFGDGPAPPAWTTEIGELIKSLAPNHLFMDGTYGIYPGTGQINVSIVDMFSDHFYPPDLSKLATDLSQVQAVNKNFLAGEIDWTGENGGDDLGTFLEAINTSPGTGTFFWSLFGHNDTCCGFVEHDDGFSFYYLRDEMFIERGDILIQGFEALNSGKSSPQVIPQVACPESPNGQLSLPAFVIPVGVDASLFNSL